MKRKEVKKVTDPYLTDTAYRGSHNLRDLGDAGYQLSRDPRPANLRNTPRLRASGKARDRVTGQVFDLTSDTLVTRADGTQYRLPRVTRKGGSRKARAATVAAVQTRVNETARVVSSYDERHRETY